ncbi:acyl-CoA thioesterase [Chloroflexota bacterium]
MISSITEIKVRGYHLDLYGHVNNARYLEFLEEARWAFAEESLDIDEWQRRGIAFSVVNININYRRPALMGEVMKIRTWVSELGNASATIRQELVLKGKETPVADADVTFVMIDAKTNKPIPLTGDIRAAFAAGQNQPVD